MDLGEDLCCQDMLTLEDTRLTHINSLGLLSAPSSSHCLETISSLGYVQIDTMNVVARTHDLTLHSRQASYEEGQVWQYLEQGKLFEEFAHARSLIPIEQFPYYYRKMLERRKEPTKLYDYLPQADYYLERTMQLVRDLGEITIDDLDFDFNIKTRWSSPKKWIIDHLVRRGYILTSRRENFSVIYYRSLEDVITDIPEEGELPTRLGSFWHDINLTLRIHGLVPLDRLLRYTYSQRFFAQDGKKQYPRTLLKQAIKQGEIIEHKVKHTDVLYYSLPSWDFEPIEFQPKVSLVSPFDNLMWSRKALEDQYGFHYKFEAYVPKKDRKYGVYSLPMLYGTSFVGRVDPKFDRSNQVLSLKQWSWEQGFVPNSDFFDELALTIRRFTQFHGATEIDWGDLKPVFAEELKLRI